jgi:hypothetical protein
MGKMIVKVQWVVVTILWVYIFYRAVFIGITQDEAYSYFLVKTNNWHAMPGSLNTHWLNTLALRLILWLPGADHIWKLRMLSVLSWWLYSYSAIKLSNIFNNKFIGLAFFFVSVLNPFLIFYFSLGRGYALACALLFFCFWRAFQTLQYREIKPVGWLKVFLPASMAVLANFSSFYFFIGVTIAYLLHVLVNKKKFILFEESALRLKFLVIGTSIFAACSLLFIRYHTNEFEGSETADLMTSLIGSQIKQGSYINFGFSIFLLASILFVVFMIFVLISSYLYFTSKVMTIGIFSILVSAVIVLCNIVFYLLFHSPFEYGRTGLIFYVAVLPGFFGTLDAWGRERKFVKYGLNTAAIFIGFLFIFNFYKGFSPDFFSEWSFQADTQKGLDYLQKMKARRVGLTLWHFAVFIHYYSKAFPDKYKFIPFMMDDRNLSNAFKYNCDYLMVNISDSVKNALISQWDVQWCSPATHAVILSKR